MTDYEKFSDYPPPQRSAAGVALTFLFLGLGLGALTALMLAPQSGKKMRKNLFRRYEDARESLEELGERAGDVFERGGAWAKAARRKVEPIAGRMRR